MFSVSCCNGGVMVRFRGGGGVQVSTVSLCFTQIGQYTAGKLDIGKSYNCWLWIVLSEHPACSIWSGLIILCQKMWFDDFQEELSEPCGIVPHTVEDMTQSLWGWLPHSSVLQVASLQEVSPPKFCISSMYNHYNRTLQCIRFINWRTWGHGKII